MVGELALTTQWCSGHRTKVRLADLIQPTEEVTGKPRKGWAPLQGAIYTRPYCVHIFFFNYGRQ